MSDKAIKLPTGKSVVAVSGGVDSMVLLDIIRRKIAPTDFVVAHFWHGTRSEDEHLSDELLIQSYCQKNGLQLEVGRSQLGSHASEDIARVARYTFLREVRDKYRYNNIITAHHLDDLIETAIINILRGTKYRGLSSMAHNAVVSRPLLDWTKQDVLAYAQRQNLRWNEDETNSDTNYLRNYVRHNIIPRMRQQNGYKSFTELILKTSINGENIKQLTKEVEQSLVEKTTNQLVLNRQAYILLDHLVAREIVRNIFYDARYGSVPDKKTIDKIAVFCKTGKSGNRIDISKSAYISLEKKKITVSLK